MLLRCGLIFFDLLMGEPQTPQFYDFETFERAPKPQNQNYLSLETPGYLTTSKENPPPFREYYFYKDLKHLEIKIEAVGKDGRRKIPTIGLIISSRSWT